MKKVLVYPLLPCRPEGVFLFLISGMVAGLLGIFLTYLFSSNPVLLWVFCLVLAHLTFLLFVRKIKGTINIASPVVFAGLCSFFYSISVPLDYLLGLMPYLDYTSLLQTIYLYGVANIALLVTMGTGIFYLTKMAPKSIDVPSLSPLAKYPSLLILGLGIILWGYDLYRMGGLEVMGIANRMASFRTQYDITETTIFLPWKPMIIAGLYGWCLTSYARRNVKKVLFFLAVLTFINIMLFGSRSNVLITSVPVLALYGDKFKLLNKKNSVIVFLIILIFLSPLFTNVRNAYIHHLNFFNLPYEAWAFSRGETGASFLVTATVRSTDSWFFAEPSYLKNALMILPQVVYKYIFDSAKPMNLGDWFVWYYYPNTFAHGGGWGFSPVAHAWMVGNYLGIIIVFFCFGIFVILLERLIFMKYLLLPTLMLFFRVSFTSFLGISFFLIAFFSLIIFVDAFFNFKNELPSFKATIKQ